MKISSKKHLNFKKMKKQVKGITLIALVVTIIVLLILAGVALNLTIGQNGIFTRAQDAANTWKNAEANEQLALQGFSDMIDEILEGPKPEEGTLAAMYVQAVEDGCTNADGNCQNPNHLHIGDYVQFANPTNAESTALATETGWESNQHYTVNSETNQLNWRVLGYDAEKMQVKLIAATPLKSDGSDGYLWMKGAQSYVTGYLVPDKISKDLYGNLPNVAEARSVKMEDINELLGIEENEIADMNAYPFIKEGVSNYGDDIKLEGAYTPEEYLEKESPDSGLGSGIDTKTVGYAFIVKTEDIEESYPIVKVENTRIYDMIFNDTEYQKGGAYWLSSRGVVADSDYAFFGLGVVDTEVGRSYAVNAYVMFCPNLDGHVDEVVNCFGLRPVVSLESGVQASDVPKIADQVNPSWGGSVGE